MKNKILMASAHAMCVLAGFVMLLGSLPGSASAQVITTTLPSPGNPYAPLAINPITNKIYTSGTTGIRVIDGATNLFTDFPKITNPSALSVDAITNTIYIWSGASIFAVDGATNTLTNTTSTNASNPTAFAINSNTKKGYLADAGSNSVIIVDLQTNSTTSVPVGSYPIGLAVDELHNKIYVANLATITVTIIDGVTNGTATVPISNSSRLLGIAVNPVTGNVYVASFGISSAYSGTVSVIDGGTGAITATVPVAYVYGPIAVNTVTNKIYVSIAGAVSVIDGFTNQVTTMQTAGSGTSIAVNPTDNRVYLSSFLEPTGIEILDGPTNAIVQVPTNGTDPYTVAVNPVTNKVYAYNIGAAAGNRCNGPIPCYALNVIDTAISSAASLSVGASPSAIAVNSATNQSFVANATEGTVTVINGVSQSATTVSIGSNPIAIATNPITNKAYISTQGSSNITILDGASNVTKAIPLGTQAGALAANPATNTVYIANPAVSTGQITILNGATNAVSPWPLGTGASAARDIAVNSATNKIYVETATGVVAVDGATSAVTTVPLSIGSDTPMGGLAVNTATNKIYVVSGSSVTVIDGATNAPTTIPVSVGSAQYIQVNAITNKIYVAGTGTGIAVIDGATNAVTAVTTGVASSGLAVNPVTNKIYDVTGANLTVMDGATNTNWTLPLLAAGTGIGINPVTDQIYVSVGSANIVQIFSERPPQSNPLTATISPLPANQTTSTTPSFTFTAQSANGTTPTGVYFQVDTWQNSWTAAVASNPSFTATMATLTPGVHTLFAYAVDGQQSGSGITALYLGQGEQTVSSTIGAIQAYTFLVAQPQNSSGGGGGGGSTGTSGTAFVTAESPGPLRNNYSGFIGFEFTVGSSSLQVSSLGRYAAPGNAGTHLLKLVNANGTDVSGGSVSLTMNSTAGQYQYTALSNSVTLAANTTYYLVSAETAGGDAWYDIGGVSASAGAVLAPAYTDSTGGYVVGSGLSGESFGPLNFQFSAGSSPTTGASTGTSFVTAETPGPLRNNYSGSVGYAFTVSQSVSVTALGRYAISGNSGQHTLQLVSADQAGNITPVASASVSLAGATAGQFDYVNLASAVTLQPNVTYYLTSQETAGGDNWYDFGGVSVTGGSVLAPVYIDGTGHYVLGSGLAGLGYVPVSFLYSSSGATPPPTTNGTALLTGQTASRLRNDYGGFVGTAIQVGATPLTVLSVGRFDAAGDTGTHLVKLVQANGTDVPGGSATVNLASATAGQYSYATLSAPVTLQANTTYYLVSQETSGGDMWYDLEPVTTTGAAQVTSAAYVDGQGHYVTVSGLAGYSYGPVNLLYQ